ncbi:MAG: Unknown protein [uncultured Thiotrichaceae bacterium]|uniref:Cysteine dioxygenase n=1 Tax=uncultured Thiotrichaceae bacterium TaxID=298394 RepID=A0A6S6UFS0_9GAMM|nr:MAG: Unknown protein [uncultured Thiotrichaceae bacterium]
MSAFTFDAFITDLQEASMSPNAELQVLALMQQAFKDPSQIADNVPAFSEEADLLLQESSITIWHWCLQPGILIPPHDHRMAAIIGIYKGTEENRFYLSENGSLQHKATKHVSQGEILSITPESIHSVQATEEQPSQGIHVYLGNLDASPRSLFNWETGEAEPYTEEAYNRLVRFT